MAGRWLDVQQAAFELGLSTDAVRKRIHRGTLVSEERDGRRVVWLDDGGTEAGHETDQPTFELIEQLRSENAYLREVVATRDEEIRRRDHIIMSALERVPELPAPEQEQTPDEPSRTAAHSDATQSPDPSAGSATSEAHTGAQRRPWWRRLFGG